MTGPSSYVMAYVSGAQQAYMLDRAVVRRYQITGSSDDYGTPEIAYIDGPELVCSFDDQRAKEQRTTAQVDTHDAIIRLPVDTVITNLDRILLTRRMDTALSPTVEYEIDGEIKRGPFGIVCPLKIYIGADNV